MKRITGIILPPLILFALAFITVPFILPAAAGRFLPEIAPYIEGFREARITWMWEYAAPGAAVSLLAGLLRMHCKRKPLRALTLLCAVLIAAASAFLPMLINGVPFPLLIRTVADLLRSGVL